MWRAWLPVFGRGQAGGDACAPADDVLAAWVALAAGVRVCTAPVCAFVRILPSVGLAASLFAQGEGVPTFARDVAPIVWRSCAGCHRPGQPAPFSLLSFDDVWKRRAQIADVTQQRLMPPWLPTHGDFVDDRRLSAAEIATLQQWAQAGGPRGEVANEPAVPTFTSGWQLGEPDLIVKVPTALRVPASGGDLVRNLVLPVDVPKLRHVAAVEIRPGSRAVHHAILGVDATRYSRQRDAADAEPGFPGMTLGAAVPPDGQFLGWTPGKSVRRAARGHAWRLRPGCDFVLQLHLVPTGKEEQVQPEIGLWFTDDPVTTTFVPVVLLNDAIDLAPGQRDFVLRDHLDLPVPVTVHALYPHAHHLCRRMRGTAKLPDGSERLLFAIDAWDFDWQDDYRFRTPVELPAGTRLAFEYVYDNSEANPNNPSRPPVRVRFGQASADEMGTLTLSVSLPEPSGQPTLEQAIVTRELEKSPDAWNVMLRQARLLRERGDVAAAKVALARARTISPGSADVVVELGLCAERDRQPAEAAALYEQALLLDPGHGLAHLQLGTLAGRAGRGAEALRHFEQAVLALPNLPLAHHNLATACFQLERLELAVVHYRRAVALAPDYFQPWLLLGRVLVRLERRDEARAALQQAAALRPADATVRAELDALGR